MEGWINDQMDEWIMFIDTCRWFHSSILNSSPVASSIGEVGEREGEDWGSPPVAFSIGEVGDGEGEGWGRRRLTRRLNVNETFLDKQV